MPEIGAFEARKHLPRLLKRVRAGERFVITRHNRPVAELIPFRTHDAGKVRAAIDDLKAFQRTHNLGGTYLKITIRSRRSPKHDGNLLISIASDFSLIARMS